MGSWDILKGSNEGVKNGKRIPILSSLFFEKNPQYVGIFMFFVSLR